MEYKLKISGARRTGVGYTITINDNDISEMVKDVIVHIRAGEVNTATITFVGVECDIEGMVDVTAIGYKE